MIFFVVPAYNEVDNVPQLFADLLPCARRLGARIVVVDDGSTDGTRDAVERSRDGYPVTLVRHDENLGLGRTIDTGIRVALADAGENDAVVTIEADNTCDLADLPKLLARFEDGYDVVAASVYAPGGKLLGVGWFRLLLSRALSAGFRIAARLPEVHTFSGVYRVYRSSQLRRAVETYGYLLVREPGYAASVELLLKLRGAGASITEVPTVNDWSRRKGSSKMRIRPTLLAYFRLVIAQLLGAIHPPPGSPLARNAEGISGARIEQLGRAEGNTALRAPS